MQSHPLRKTHAKEDYPFMKTVIGICPLWDETKDSLWMIPGYMNMLEEQGAVPLMMPLTTDTGILDYSVRVRRLSPDRRAGCVSLPLRRQSFRKMRPPMSGT